MSIDLQSFAFETLLWTGALIALVLVLRRPVSRHFDVKGYHVTTGIGPDLMEGARAAVSGMIDLQAKLHGLTATDAYMLCSVCADLRISEVVDVPNWVVSYYFPKVVFD